MPFSFEVNSFDSGFHSLFLHSITLNSYVQKSSYITITKITTDKFLNSLRKTTEKAQKV